MPFLSPGDLPDPGIEPWFPELLAVFLLTELPGKDRWVYFAVIYLVIDFVFLCVLILFSTKERKKKDSQERDTSIINTGLSTEMESLILTSWETTKFREKLRRKLTCAKAIHRDP